MVPFPSYFFGAAHLRSPTGGWAKGMPKYSDTSGFQLEAWPTTEPLLVFTLCPTFQAGCWSEADTASSAAAKTDMTVLDMVGILLTSRKSVDRRKVSGFQIS